MIKPDKLNKPRAGGFTISFQKDCMTNNVTDKIIKYLELNKVSFKGITHASAASAEEYRQTMGTRLEQQAKALFVQFRNLEISGFAIIAIQAQKKADFDLIS
jgi:hypothetical protein